MAAAVPAHGDGLVARLVGRGLAGCDRFRTPGSRPPPDRPTSPGASTSGSSAPAPAPRSSIWSRRPARATASARPATTASSSPPPTTAARTGTRRCRSPPARRGPRRSSRRSRSTATPRPRLRRVHEAHLRGCQLHRQPAGLRDLPDLLRRTAGARGSSPGACRPSPLPAPITTASPSLAVLPDGRVIVAFRNDADATAGRDGDLHVLPAPPAANYCGPPTSGLVGREHRRSATPRRRRVSGLPGATPSVVAAGGRVTVAWQRSRRRCRARVRCHVDGRRRDVRAGAADRSRRAPATSSLRGSPPTAGGRVDVAYLWDPAGTGHRRRDDGLGAAAAAGRATTEAWAQPVVVQAVGARLDAHPGQTALGRGSASRRASRRSARCRRPSWPSRTRQSGNQDVHVVGLLHGTTAPVIDARRPCRPPRTPRRSCT